MVPWIQVIMTNQHDQLLNDLVKFVTDSSYQLHRLSQTHTPTTPHSQTKLPPSRLEIPTAVLVAGET